MTEHGSFHVILVAVDNLVAVYQRLCLSAICKQNVLISLRLIDSVGCRSGFIFEHGCYISALAPIRMLILSIYVFLECINKICK